MRIFRIRTDGSLGREIDFTAGMLKDFEETMGDIIGYSLQDYVYACKFPPKSPLIFKHKSASGRAKDAGKNSVVVAEITITGTKLENVIELEEIILLHLGGKIMIPDASSLPGNTDSFIRGVKNDLRSLKIFLTRKVMEWKQRIGFRIAASM